MTTGATMFSGGGGVEALLKERVDFLWAIESEADIAAVYRQNHGNHVIVGDVCDQDYQGLPRVDYLHASPVCKNASQAKTDGVESDIDIQTAEAVCRALRAIEPRVFTLENVFGYRTFDAFRRICRTLDMLGYMWHFEHVNAADFGVPQTRKRLILRAVRDALLPNWPAPEPWVGWYESIEDLIPTLPPSQFAAWQLARLDMLAPGGILQTALMPCRSLETNLCYAETPSYTVLADHKQSARAFIVSNAATMDARGADEPMVTVTATTHSKAAMPRAFLVSNAKTEFGDGLRTDDEPSHAITEQANGRTCAFLVPDQNNGNGRGQWVRGAEQPSMSLGSTASARAWLSQGRVVKMTPRALARFQSVPDWYILPEKTSLACTVLGNMCPPLLMLKIVRPLL